MAIELGKAYVQIVPSAEGIKGKITEVMGGEAASAGKKSGEAYSSGFSGILKGGLGAAAKVGATALTAAFSAATAAGGALLKSASNAASFGDNIDKMSQKMGLSAEKYQEWDAILQHSGTSMETMKSGMKTLANAVEKGNGAFERIGLSMEDISGMSQEDLFAATISGLQKVDNETERTYLAGQLLGRGATELGALLNTSAEDTEAMRQRLHDLGGVMSDDAVKAAAAYQDSLQDMQTAFAGMTRSMVGDMLPSLTQIMDGLTAVFAGDESGIGMITAGFDSLVQNLSNAIPQVITIGSQLINGLITALVTNLPMLIESGAQLVTQLILGLVGAVPTLVAQIPAIVSALVNGFMAAAPTLMSAGQDLIGQAANGIQANLPQILDQGVQMIANFVNGILQSLPQVITAAGEIATNLLNYVMQIAPDLLKAGVELILQLVNGLLQSLPQIYAAAVEVVGNLTNTVLQNAPQLLSSGIELIGQLAAGLLEAIPRAVEIIPQLTQSIIDKIMSINWLDVGWNIIKGIADGIWKAAGLLAQAAENVAKGALNKIKSALGISSPSKVFADQVGKWIPPGIAEGITSNLGTVEDAMDDLSANAVGALNTSALSTQTASAGATTNMGGITINVYAAEGQSVRAIAQKVVDIIRDQEMRGAAAYA